MTMLRWMLLLVLVAAGAGSAAARQDAPADTVTVSGYLVDAKCGNAIARKSEPMAKAARHTRACGLNESCAAEGYGIFSDGAWILFDEKGNSLANAALEADERARGNYFTVRGVRVDGHLAVLSIDPAPAPGQ